MAEQKLTSTELLERDYGSDEMAQKLIASFRTDEKQTDEEIYKFLESFYYAKKRRIHLKHAVLILWKPCFSAHF